jgi:hypothetical protein
MEAARGARFLVHHKVDLRCDVAEYRLRHGDADLLKLTDDAEISPPGILPCQAADQVDRLFGKGRTSWSAMRAGPALLDQRAVPTEDRLGRDEE